MIVRALKKQVDFVEPISKMWIRVQGKASRELKRVYPSVHEVREYFDLQDNAALGT